jgi:hypothetical protein
MGHEPAGELGATRDAGVDPLELTAKRRPPDDGDRIAHRHVRADREAPQARRGRLPGAEGHLEDDGRAAVASRRRHGHELARGVEHEGGGPGALLQSREVLGALGVEVLERVGAGEHDVLGQGLRGDGHGSIVAATPMAASRAAAFAWHSSSSRTGSESNTMPAPACTEARPSASTTSVRMAMAVSRFPSRSR